MDGFARGFGTVVLSIIALLAVLAGIGWGVTYYIDENFGDGTAAIIFAVLIGISMTVLIYTLSGFQNNQTHRSAGEDITSFAANMAKANAEQWRVQREWARQDREVATLGMRSALVDKKAQQRRDDHAWRVEQRAAEARAAEEAEWAWVDDEADAEAPIFFE